MKEYHNLTQCIGERMVYFRSTDVEQRNYHRLLWSVPDEWFFFLFKGEPIKVIDKSGNGRGKIERIFIPVLSDLLNYYLLKIKPENKVLIDHFAFGLCAIEDDGQLKRKILFWRGKIKEIDISAKTIHVDKEVVWK
jgi:hypothetical protein